MNIQDYKKYQAAKKAGYSDQEIDSYLISTGKNPSDYKMNFGQKAANFAAGAAPVVGSVIGGLAGTALSPVAGSAAGATAGYLGGRAIGENLQDLAGIQDETAPEMVKSMATEAAITGGTSLALGLAGKGVSAIGSKVRPKFTTVGKSLSEKVVPPKIKGYSPDMMSRADDVFNIRQKLGLTGAPSSQARQAEAIWKANKKTVETLLKDESITIPGRAIRGSVDDAVANTVGFDETSSLGRKTVKQALGILSDSKDAHQLFINQQKIGTMAFTGRPTPEKDFLKNVYGKVGDLISEVSPQARTTIAQNAEIRSIMPSLKSAISKEGFSVKEALGTAAATAATPSIPGKIGVMAGGFLSSTKPGMSALDKISRGFIKAGVKKETIKKVLSNSDVIKALLSTAPSARPKE